MFKHRRNYEKGVEVFFAQQGELTAGWVIGVVNPDAVSTIVKPA
jgi:hypothetical protein